MKSRRSVTASFIVLVLLSVSLVGCTGVLAPISPTARLEVDVDSIHVGEAVNLMLVLQPVQTQLSSLLTCGTLD